MALFEKLKIEKANPREIRAVTHARYSRISPIAIATFSIFLTLLK